MLEASALLNPKAICSLVALLLSYLFLVYPVIIPSFLIVAIAGLSLFPLALPGVWVPCKSIPIFWLPYKLIAPFIWNSKFSLASSTTKALLLLTETLIVFVSGSKTEVGTDEPLAFIVT